MPALTQQQWDEVRRAYIGNSETVQAIADRFGIRHGPSPPGEAEGWPRRPLSRSAKIVCARPVTFSA
jgi:hypothetical protein